MDSVVLGDALRQVDFRERSMELVGKCPRDVLDEVTMRALAVVDPGAGILMEIGTRQYEQNHENRARHDAPVDEAVKRIKAAPAKQPTKGVAGTEADG